MTGRGVIRLAHWMAPPRGLFDAQAPPDTRRRRRAARPRGRGGGLHRRQPAAVARRSRDRADRRRDRDLDGPEAEADQAPSARGEGRQPLLEDVRRWPDEEPGAAADPPRDPGEAAALGPRAQVVRRVSAELLRRRALRQHLQGRHVGDQGQDRQGDLAAAQHGAEAVHARDQRRAPDREREGRHRQRAEPRGTAGSSGSCARTRRSSRHPRSSRASPTSERPTAASSRSGPRPARSAGSTTPAAGSTPARRSPTGACA